MPGSGSFWCEVFLLPEFIGSVHQNLPADFRSKELDGQGSEVYKTAGKEGKQMCEIWKRNSENVYCLHVTLNSTLYRIVMKLGSCWNYFYIETVWDEQGCCTVGDSFPYISY